MAKQYVGARYVPITYENPDDGSANWKANVEYESLTIVVASNGNSYTSKKAVPRSVGAPQDNPEYWVKTGDFNASLLALQGRVNNIENTVIPEIQENVSDNADNIDEIMRNVSVSNYFKGKKVVVYGDSITTTSYNWPSVLSGTYGIDVTNRGVGGDFLTRPSITGHTAGIEQINAATDLDDFDICLIAYGTNDWQISRDAHLFAATIKEAIKKFDGMHCEPIFILPPFGYSEWTINGQITNNNEKGQSIEAFVDLAIEICEAFNKKYVNLYKLFPAYVDSWQAFLRDETKRLHPTQLGGQIIAQVIANACFNTGKCFDGAYEYADKVWESFALPSYGTIPSLAGHHVVGKSNSSFGGVTVKFKTSGMHRYKITGTVHTDTDDYVKISPNFIGATFQLPHYANFYAKDGDNICAYGACDGTEFNLRVFTCGTATCVYIENLSVMFDEELEPTRYTMDFDSTKVTPKKPIGYSVHDECMFFETLDFTTADTLNGVNAIANMIHMQDRFFMPVVSNNEVAQFVLLFANDKIYTVGNIPSGTRVICKIPPIVHKSVKSDDD